MPSIPVSRQLHAMLSFITIAIEELKPRYMRGYGALTLQGEQLLNDIAGELMQAVLELDKYVNREVRGKSEHEHPYSSEHEKDERNC